MRLVMGFDPVVRSMLNVVLYAALVYAVIAGLRGCAAAAAASVSLAIFHWLTSAGMFFLSWMMDRLLRPGRGGTK